MFRLFFTFSFTVAFCAVSTVAIAQSATRSKAPAAAGSGTRVAGVATKVGLQGFCPVCVVEMKAWEKGNPAFASTYDATTYHFPNAEIKAKFDARPSAYVPVLGGDCIVCYAKMDARVPGSINHSSLFGGRLFLFPSEKEKRMFEADPEAFANVDIAAAGNCIVCLVKSGKQVPGTMEHAVIYQGMRYLFPSANEAQVFMQSPDHFVQAASRLGAAKPAMAPAITQDASVRLVGRSGCAACEFGVKPIQAPDQLGLAVVSGDGQVTVVEGAHVSHPAIYEDRFSHRNLEVQGKIVKTSGKFTWIEPTSIKVMQ